MPVALGRDGEAGDMGSTCHSFPLAIGVGPGAKKEEISPVFRPWGIKGLAELQKHQ